MSVVKKWSRIQCWSIRIAVVALASTQTAVLSASDDVAAVSYSGEVASIINENCVVCHRQGGIGPMALTSYDQVHPWAPLIQLKVANRDMPPYAYDHDIGLQDLQADWRLSQDEIDTIVAWVDQGSPAGNLDEMPAPPVLRGLDDWNFAEQFGEPDVVLSSQSIDVPASGNDLWDKHFVDSGITEDRCIKALQVKPRGDAKTVDLAQQVEDETLRVIATEKAELDRIRAVQSPIITKLREIKTPLKERLLQKREAELYRRRASKMFLQCTRQRSDGANASGYWQELPVELLDLVDEFNQQSIDITKMILARIRDDHELVEIVSNSLEHWDLDNDCVDLSR